MIEVDDPLVSELCNKIAQRRDAIMREWPKFRRDVSTVVVVEEVLDRLQAGLPDEFVPWASGIVVPSSLFLEAAKRRSKGSRASDWNNVDARGRRNDGFFSKWLSNEATLRVRGCGQFWTVERTLFLPHRVFQILVYPFGALPVFARTHKQAMQVAQYCHSCPPGPASILRWVEEHCEVLGLSQDAHYSPDARQLIQDTALGVLPLPPPQSAAPQPTT